MKSFNVFVCNELTNLEYMHKLLHYDSFSIAETQGRLYSVYRTPTLIVNDDVLRWAERRVYGVMYTFTKYPLKRLLYTLDAYHGCSSSRSLGVANPYDLTTREQMYVNPLQYESIEDFLNYRHTYLEQEIAYTWIGNQHNKYVKKALYFENKIKNGIYLKEMQHTLNKAVTYGKE